MVKKSKQSKKKLVNKKDYYDILKVSPLASHSAIKKSYKNLIQQYHPDRNPGNLDAVQMFKIITDAYEVLGDVFKRKSFDQQRRKEELKRQREKSKPTPLYEAFNTYKAFHSVEEKAAAVNASLKEDKNLIPVEISLEEAAFGCKKEFTLQKNQVCFVIIPPAIEENQKLKIESATKSSLRILYSLVVYKKHPLFTKKGSDIFIDLPVSFTKAVLGGKVEVPTLTKSVSFQLPSMSHSGHIMELKNQGFPLTSYSQTKRRGSMFITILIDIPSDLSEEERGWVKRIHKNLSVCPKVEEFKTLSKELLKNRDE